MKQTRYGFIVGSLMLMTVVNGMKCDTRTAAAPKTQPGLGHIPKLDIWKEELQTLSLTQSIAALEVIETLNPASATLLDTFYTDTKRVIFHVKNRTSSPIILTKKLWEDTLPDLHKQLPTILQNIGARNLLTPFIPLNALMTQKGYLVVSGPYEETYHTEKCITVEPGQNISIIAFIKKS